MSQSAEKSVRLVNSQGLHMRPADLLVRKANSFAAEVQVSKGEHVVDGKSIISILTLAADEGTELRIAANGEDAAAAVNALVELIQNGFTEDDIQEDGTQLAGEHKLRTSRTDLVKSAPQTALLTVAFKITALLS